MRSLVSLNYRFTMTFSTIQGKKEKWNESLPSQWTICMHVPGALNIHFHVPISLVGISIQFYLYPIVSSYLQGISFPHQTHTHTNSLLIILCLLYHSISIQAALGQSGFNASGKRKVGKKTKKGFYLDLCASNIDPEGNRKGHNNKRDLEDLEMEQVKLLTAEAKVSWVGRRVRGKGRCC